LSLENIDSSERMLASVIDGRERVKQAALLLAELARDDDVDDDPGRAAAGTAQSGIRVP